MQPSGTSIQVGNRDVESSITPPSHTSTTASTDSSSALNSGHRVVETGVIFPFIKHSFVCCFQSEPFWLLALDPSFTSRIYVDNSISSFTDFHFYLSTYNRLNLFNKMVSRLGRSKFIFDFRLDSLARDTIVLISGSPEFFQLTVHRYSNFHTLFIGDSHFGGRRLPQASLPLRRIHHTDVGGPTSFIAIVGSVPEVKPTQSQLQRRIKHFFDFSIRPSST